MFVRKPDGECLSANLMVSVCLSANFMMNVCLSANFVVSVSLSANPAMSVSVSVSVRDTISRLFCFVSDSVPSSHMPGL